MEQLKIKGIYKGEFSDMEHGACTGLHGTGAMDHMHSLCCNTLYTYLHCLCCNTLYICTVCVEIHYIFALFVLHDIKFMHYCVAIH